MKYTIAYYVVDLALSEIQESLASLGAGFGSALLT